MDAQANLTVGLGLNLRTVELSMADVLTNPAVSIEDVIVPTQNAGIDVAPQRSTYRPRKTRSTAPSDASTHCARHSRDPSRIATTSSSSTARQPWACWTINALVASDSVIIPVQTQYYALKGFSALVGSHHQIRTRGLNPDLRILGLLPTFFDSRTLLGRDMLEELRGMGEHHIFESMIRKTVRLGEAPLVGRPVTAYATNSEAARAYRGLAREVIELG